MWRMARDREVLPAGSRLTKQGGGGGREGGGGKDTRRNAAI